jgi:hypothetical protein
VGADETAGRDPGDTSGPLGIPGYDDVEEIGRGGFGVVYRARQRDLDRTVAVKLLTTAADGRSQTRFDRERRSLGALSDHPNIVTIYESGTTRHGLPYLTMEYLAGGSLADRLEATGPLPWPTAVTAIVAVCGAVETAHRIGVLHRDIKPENILLDRRDQARLADFGIAGHLAGTATATGSITASIGHAAPEVLAGQRSTPATDVYSLGSTLFALVAGRAAFVRPTDETLMPVVVRVSSEPVPDLRPAGVPDEVCAAIEAAMAKDAAQRPASASAFGESLQAALVRHRLPVAPMVIEAITVEPPTAAVPAVDGAAGSPVTPVASLVVGSVGAGVAAGQVGAGSATGAAEVGAGTRILSDAGADVAAFAQPPTIGDAGAVAGNVGSAGGGPTVTSLPDPGKSGGAARRLRRSQAKTGSGAPPGTAADGRGVLGKWGPRAGRRGRMILGATVATVTAVGAMGAVALTGGDEDPSLAGGPGETAVVATVESAPSSTAAASTSASTASSSSTSSTSSSTTTSSTATTTAAAAPVAEVTSGRVGEAAVSPTPRPSPPPVVDEPEAPIDGGGVTPAPEPPPPPPPAAPVTEPPTTVPTVAMPAILGLTEVEAYDAVRSAQSSLRPQGYYAYTTQKSCNGNIDPANFGRVYAQSPAAGSPLTFHQPATASIYLACTTVPEVTGFAHSAAVNAIYGAALQVSVSGRVACQPGVAGSTVVTQDPAPGTILPNSGIVSLVETAVNCP